MSAPLTKTFYESPLSKELLSTLKRANKTLDDIEYVAYALAQPNYGHINYFRCNITEFLSATTLATSAFDINWPMEIFVVGNGFWLNYDFHGLWTLHVPPTKPEVYRRPLPCDLLREGGP